jgi:hypothetical protein
MGYEIKMYVVESRGTLDEGGATYASVVGMVDLCKMNSRGPVCALDEKRPKKPALYIFANDGNTKIENDDYGKPLGVYKPQEFLHALKKDEPRYRRTKMAIALLESAMPEFDDELRVLTYGH